MPTEILPLKAIAGACKKQLVIVQSEWPQGIPITLDSAVRAIELELDLDWMAHHILTAPALAEYDRVTAPARAEYKRVTATAWAEYDRVTAPALAEYDRVTAPARAEYDRITATSRAEYHRVKATARAKYNRVTATALVKLAQNPENRKEFHAD